jgi:hypothetical protein
VTPKPFAIEALTSVKETIIAAALVLEVSEVDRPALQALSRLRQLEAVCAGANLLHLEGFTLREIG